jgi:hypothetical protein
VVEEEKQRVILSLSLFVLVLDLEIVADSELVSDSTSRTSGYMGGSSSETCVYPGPDPDIFVDDWGGVRFFFFFARSQPEFSPLIGCRSMPSSGRTGAMHSRSPLRVVTREAASPSAGQPGECPRYIKKPKKKKNIISAKYLNVYAIFPLRSIRTLLADGVRSAFSD